MFRKIGLVVGLIFILVGCQGQKFFPEAFELPAANERPAAERPAAERPVVEASISEKPVPVDESSFLGRDCDMQAPSHVIERDTWYRSCVENVWTKVGKDDLESRVITYNEAHVNIFSAEPLLLGSGAQHGQCLYTINYVSDYKERAFIDRVTKLEFDWVLSISVRQDNPAVSPADCEIKTSEAAKAVILENWNIDPISQKIMGRKHSA